MENDLQILFYFLLSQILEVLIYLIQITTVIYVFCACFEGDAMWARPGKTLSSSQACRFITWLPFMISSSCECHGSIVRTTLLRFAMFVIWWHLSPGKNTIFKDFLWGHGL